MINIAVTGANGFIGSWICHYLKEKYHVRAVVRRGSDISMLTADVELFPVDYQDVLTLENVFKNCSVVIHCAALTKAKDWGSFKKANIDLTNELIDLCNRIPTIRQFIFLSSQAAGGMPSAYANISEDQQCPILSQYGLSKKIAEDNIKKFCTIPFTIVRPVSVFGPGDKDFLQIFRAISKGFAPAIGFKKSYLNLLYVELLADFIKRIILNDDACNHTFYVHDGRNYESREFLELLRMIVNPNAKTVLIPVFVIKLIAELNSVWSSISGTIPVLNRLKARELTGRYWLCSIDNARKKIGFSPDNDISESIRKTHEWYLEHGWLS